MASNEIPRSYDPLVEHMEDAADGAHTYEVAVGLKANKETNIRADLHALIGTPAGPGGVPPAEPGFKAFWNVSKANKTAKTSLLRNVLSNARLLVTTCINSLKPVLGQQWNSAWNAAGFTTGSLAVPTNPMVLLGQLRAYYEANPAREATVQTIECTAANCEATVQAISDAQSASNQSNTDAGTAKAALEAGLRAGIHRLTGLREELTQLIGDDDERWYAFGFNKPSDPSTPEVPDNVVVTPGAPGSRMLILNWDDARRATSYRVRAVHNGVQVANVIAQDSEFTLVLTGVAIGTIVEITVSSRDSAGESQPSAPITIAVP